MDPVVATADELVVARALTAMAAPPDVISCCEVTDAGSGWIELTVLGSNPAEILGVFVEFRPESKRCGAE